MSASSSMSSNLLWSNSTHRLCILMLSSGPFWLRKPKALVRGGGGSAIRRATGVSACKCAGLESALRVRGGGLRGSPLHRRRPPGTPSAPLRGR
jgi:hypothetical protein